MADRSWWQRALRRLGVESHRLDDLKPVYDADAAAAGRYIFVHDDSVSRMDIVTKWLERSFDLEAGRAALIMVGIHHHGLAAMGPYTAEESIERLERARRIAAELGLTKLAFSRQPPVAER